MSSFSLLFALVLSTDKLILILKKEKRKLLDFDVGLLN